MFHGMFVHKSGLRLVQGTYLSSRFNSETLGKTDSLNFEVEEVERRAEMRPMRAEMRPIACLSANFSKEQREEQGADRGERASTL